MQGSHSEKSRRQRSLWLAWLFLFVAPLAYGGGGVPLWTNYYRGPGAASDSPVALAVDATGKVYVTGYSGDSTGKLTYATVAYASSGDPLWTNRYKGPGNQDLPVSIAVDTNGHVVVTGYSVGADLDSQEFATVAYSSAGVPLWTNRFQWPGNKLSYATALGLDGSGNVFVTGHTSSNASAPVVYATVAYSASGSPLWTNRYNGPGDGSAMAKAIAVSRDGGVVVTGSSIGPSGSWDYTTIKYSGGGVPLWTNQYGTVSNGDSIANGIAVDRDGRTFVTGWSIGGTGNSNYATIAYSAAGSPLWTNLFSESATNHSDAQSLALDDSGNVFVSGFTRSEYASHVVTIGYAGSGTPLWTNRTAGAYPDGRAIAADASGNVFVTGAPGTVGYSAVGVPLWTNEYPAQYFGGVIATDPGGNVIVAGGSYSATGYVTIKYSSSAMPVLSIAPGAGEVILSWKDSGFHLQSAPNVSGPFTNVASATSPYTNAAGGAEKYFRLAAP